jgi:hypothetical protein
MGEASVLHSTPQPSPGFRYNYDESFDPPQVPQILVSDLERKMLTRIHPHGWPQGWWDERSIVIKDPTNNFILCDAVTARTSPLLSSAQVAGFFKKMHIPAAPATASLFSIWNGKENDFYLTDLNRNGRRSSPSSSRSGDPDPR